MSTPSASLLAELARRFARAAREGRSHRDASGLTETERTGGELVAALVQALEPGLGRAAQAAPILLTERGATPAIAVTAAGALVRLTEPRQHVEPAELVRARRDLRAVLNQLDVALIAANDAEATASAMIVRDARAVLEAELAGTSAAAP